MCYGNIFLEAELCGVYCYDIPPYLTYELFEQYYRISLVRLRLNNLNNNDNTIYLYVTSIKYIEMYTYNHCYLCYDINAKEV